MVEVFREVRRVLRKDGTLWLNYGDCYACSSNGRSAEDTKAAGNDDRTFRDKPFGTSVSGLKPKDLVGMPWMLAFALRADGWWLRSDIIWSKPNPMPESVTDRPTKAHEYLFLLAKSERYYYDAEAIREDAEYGRRKWSGGNGFGQVGDSTNPPARLRGSAGSAQPEYGRNRRTVWTIPTSPYPDAHFATFPPDLVRPCILAGTSERGCCSECGAPWVRVTERQKAVSKNCPKTLAAHGARGGTGIPCGTVGKSGSGRIEGYSLTTGWNPSCKCVSGEPIPATVLDPFAGSCTTGQVALEYGRRFIGIEISESYCELGRKRMAAAVAQELLAL